MASNTKEKDFTASNSNIDQSCLREHRPICRRPQCLPLAGWGRRSEIKAKIPGWLPEATYRSFTASAACMAYVLLYLYLLSITRTRCNLVRMPHHFPNSSQRHPNIREVGRDPRSAQIEIYLSNRMLWVKWREILKCGPRKLLREGIYLGEVTVTFRYPKSSNRYECYSDSFSFSATIDSFHALSFCIVQSIRLIE